MTFIAFLDRPDALRGKPALYTPTTRSACDQAVWADPSSGETRLGTVLKCPAP
ncbi:MAG: hypothetical protein MK160_12410 [Rhodobacteraceae bacterium]|nr:hypothetical protein [Paracoccaceae bacterium]